MTEQKKILFVVTSSNKFGTNDKPTGYWLEELAAPFNVLSELGYEITIASPEGGAPPVDPGSLAEGALNEHTKAFQENEKAQEAINNTLVLAEIVDSLDQYDALFFPGGHGPLFDLVDNLQSIQAIETFNNAGKPVGAVCHGPAVLVNAKNSDGTPLVAGKNVTGFSNAEEEAVGLTALVPLSIEDKFKELGGQYIAGDNWAAHIQVAGNLVTGQNPGSSEATAKALAELLQ